MFKLPLALRGKVGMFGDALQDDISVGHGLKRSLVFEFMTMRVRVLCGCDCV
jgi:hypothetical protein